MAALWKAFHFGAPPHGGIAPGLDRIVMLLAGKADEATPALMPMRFVARESHLSAARAVRA